MPQLDQNLVAALRHSLEGDSTATGMRAPAGAAPISGGDHLLYRELSHSIVGAAIEVHRHMGPGQLELPYQRALEKELRFRGIASRAQVPVPSLYKGEVVGEFFIDLVVEDKVVLELKAVTAVLAVHRAQVISYLKATRFRLGLLINFNVPVLHRGVTRLIV